MTVQGLNYFTGKGRALGSTRSASTRYAPRQASPPSLGDNQTVQPGEPSVHSFQEIGARFLWEGGEKPKESPGQGGQSAPLAPADFAALRRGASLLALVSATLYQARTARPSGSVSWSTAARSRASSVVSASAAAAGSPGLAHKV